MNQLFNYDAKYQMLCYQKWRNAALCSPDKAVYSKIVDDNSNFYKGY